MLATMVAGGIVALLARWNADGPLGELAGNVRLNVAWLMVACVVSCVARARLWVASFALLLSFWHAWPWRDLGPARFADRTWKPRVEFVVATLNVHYETTDFRGLEAWLGTTEAEVVALTEVSRPGWEVLGRCSDRFPYRVVAPFPEGGVEVYTQALLSRFPIVRHEFDAPRPRRAGSEEAPIVGPRYGAELDVDGVAVEVVLTHAPRPLGPVRHRFRVEHFAALAARKWSPRSLLVGDLNATSGSPLLRGLMRDSVLRDSRIGRGVQATWAPTRGLAAWPRWLTAPVSLDLDHVLVGPSILVLDRRVGPPTGSDHRPVEARLGVR